MPNMLAGKIAIITGSGNGIGRAHSISMANQGAKVVVNDLGTSSAGIGASSEAADATVKTIKDAGGTAVANYDSVTTRAGAEAIVKTAIDNFGRVDILVNNAGVVRDPYCIDELPEEDWEMYVKTHLYGTFYMTRCASGYMKKQKYGRIINTSSHTGLGWKGFAAYGLVKEGIAGFTRTVARDLAEFGITCNAIRPIAAWRGRQVEEDVKPAMGHLPEDIAPLVTYLASEPADHISGRIFEVWHGHVGIFQEPPPVENIVEKDGRWTPEELAEIIPEKLTKGQSREVFKESLKMIADDKR